jgi:hypothetical protein
MLARRISLALAALACAVTGFVVLSPNRAEAVKIKGGAVNIDTDGLAEDELDDWVDTLRNNHPRYGLTRAEANEMLAALIAIRNFKQNGVLPLLGDVPAQQEAGGNRAEETGQKSDPEAPQPENISGAAGDLPLASEGRVVSVVMDDSDHVKPGQAPSQLPAGAGAQVPPKGSAGGVGCEVESDSDEEDEEKRKRREIERQRKLEEDYQAWRAWTLRLKKQKEKSLAAAQPRLAKKTANPKKAGAKKPSQQYAAAPKPSGKKKVALHA